MSVPVDDGNCFACGPENPIGLHLHFDADGDGDGVRAETTLAPEFQGWNRWRTAASRCRLSTKRWRTPPASAGHRGVTASVNVRFRKPVPIGEPIPITRTRHLGSAATCWASKHR